MVSTPLPRVRTKVALTADRPESMPPSPTYPPGTEGVLVADGPDIFLVEVRVPDDTLVAWYQVFELREDEFERV